MHVESAFPFAGSEPSTSSESRTGQALSIIYTPDNRRDLEESGLTFHQELWKAGWSALFTAFFTALFVVVGGGILIGKWENRREDFNLRASILERAFACAQGMFSACNHASRQFRTAGLGADAQAAVRKFIDEEHLDFQKTQRTLRAIIGARYGDGGFKVVEGRRHPETPFGRWAQLTDLLDVYYFATIQQFPGNTAERNSLGNEGYYRSGLTLSNYGFDTTTVERQALCWKVKPADKSPEYKQLREEARRSYTKSMHGLGAAILNFPIATGGS